MYGYMFAFTGAAAFLLTVNCQDTLDTLGERINQHVQQQLAPLEGLGERINMQVQQSLRNGFPFGNDDIDDSDYQPRLPSYSHNYYTRPRRPDRFNMGLGDEIQRQVEQSLLPVRAMEMQTKMEGGVGGVTIITYSPGGKQFIAKNNVRYECSGTISNNGDCSGNLIRYRGGNKRTDFCYVENYSQVNQWLCFSYTGHSASFNNGVFKCESTDNNPTLSTTVDDYNRMCNPIAKEARYRYIANPSHPAHVQIPSNNPYVKCTNNQQGVCEFVKLRSFARSSNGNNI